MHAIPVQAVVSSSHKFQYMSALCAGSTNYCTAFAVSGLGRRLRTVGLVPGFWVAGDAAYEFRDGIFDPWSKSALQCPRDGDARDSFNLYHSRARIHVEQTFGILVALFGILWSPLRFDLTKVPLIISACMRVHNFCVDQVWFSLRQLHPNSKNSIASRHYHTMKFIYDNQLTVSPKNGSQ